MLRVILDTNVLVSASRSKKGASAVLLNLLAQNRFAVVVSVPLVLEYEEVLLRHLDTGAWNKTDVAILLDFICKVGEARDISFSLRPTLNDPDDDFLVELAFAASVDYLVTHNVRDLAGSKSYGVTLITPGQFLKMLRGMR